MKYDKYFELVLNKINSSIATTDSELKERVYFSFINWYKKNYEEKVRNAIENGEEYKLINITHQIVKVCECSDIDKLKITFEDACFEKLKEISLSIFKYAEHFSLNGKKLLSDKMIQEYQDRVNELKSEISPIFGKEVKEIVSEISLDLNYLKNNGNVSVYSLRMGRYIMNKQGSINSEI